MSTARYEYLLQRLRRCGFRLTPQRMAVLRTVAEDISHPTVEQVYDRVRADYPTTSLATIYKTIDMLKGIGEVLELSVGESHRYDGRDPRPHPHLICEICGVITDLKIDEHIGSTDFLRSLAIGIAAMCGYHGVIPQLEFRGRCPTCEASVHAIDRSLCMCEHTAIACRR